jgi:prenylcysteine oxidase/farnesylcysteine lyase
MRKTVAKFLNMYEPPYFPFLSLTDTVFDLGLSDLTSVPGNAFLDANHIGKLFSRDIIMASTRVNYAQNLAQIHGMGSVVCLATEDAIAIDGGNWQIFDGMIKASAANLQLNTTVSRVSKRDDGTYFIEAESTSATSIESQHSYDSVVLATPLQFSGIKLDPAPNKTPDEIPYVKLHVTLFSSPHKISPLFFGLPPTASVPEVILTTLPESTNQLGNLTAPDGFFSISSLRKISNTEYNPPRNEYLYKIFSPQPLNSSLLSRLLGLTDPLTDIHSKTTDDISWLYQKSWFAYPYLFPRITFEDPQLDADLWYTSGVESFISTMETSSLMGMNIAKLIVNGWEDLPGEDHAELKL